MHAETQSTRRDCAQGVCFRWRVQPCPTRPIFSENCYISHIYRQRQRSGDCAGGCCRTTAGAGNDEPVGCCAWGARRGWFSIVARGMEQPRCCDAADRHESTAGCSSAAGQQQRRAIHAGGWSALEPESRRIRIDLRRQVAVLIALVYPAINSRCRARTTALSSSSGTMNERCREVLP
jgi:hypothetical protein